MQVVVSDLVKRYEGAAVVKHVSFEVAEGTLLTLLGPSGSGKTTTLMAIAGFVQPDSGLIEIDGKDITHLSPNRRGLGVVFQSYALFPHKSVFENVAFPLEIRKRSRSEITARVERMLSRVGLSELHNRNIAQLSGGQKQRVALARALIFEPSVLLMDEPLGALDKKLRERLQQEIKSLQSSLGVTAIHVTHDQEEALVISDRIAVMNDGELLQIGSPSQLYDEPANRFVAEFLGGVNLLPVAETRRYHGEYEAVLAGDVHVPCHPCARFSEPAAWVGIRPERVRLSSSNKGLFSATVTQRLYLGTSMQYELEVHQGLRLQARVPTDVSQPVWEEGAQVSVSWSAQSAWLFD